MYKELNKIFSMIQTKTELKSEKVELALELGGIKTMSSSLKGSQIKDVMLKYELASKELGVKPNTIKEYKLLEEGLKLTSVYIAGADRDLKPITKIVQKLR